MESEVPEKSLDSISMSSVDGIGAESTSSTQEGKRIRKPRTSEHVEGSLELEDEEDTSEKEGEYSVKGPEYQLYAYEQELVVEENEKILDKGQGQGTDKINIIKGEELEADKNDLIEFGSQVDVSEPETGKEEVGSANKKIPGDNFVYEILSKRQNSEDVDVYEKLKTQDSEYVLISRSELQKTSENTANKEDQEFGDVDIDANVNNGNAVSVESDQGKGPSKEDEVTGNSQKEGGDSNAETNVRVLNQQGMSFDSTDPRIVIDECESNPEVKYIEDERTLSESSGFSVEEGEEKAVKNRKIPIESEIKEFNDNQNSKILEDSTVVALKEVKESKNKELEMRSDSDESIRKAAEIVSQTLIESFSSISQYENNGNAVSAKSEDLKDNIAGQNTKITAETESSLSSKSDNACENGHKVETKDDPLDQTALEGTVINSATINNSSNQGSIQIISSGESNNKSGTFNDKVSATTENSAISKSSVDQNISQSDQNMKTNTLRDAEKSQNRDVKDPTNSSVPADNDSIVDSSLQSKDTLSQENVIQQVYGVNQHRAKDVRDSAKIEQQNQSEMLSEENAGQKNLNYTKSEGNAPVCVKSILKNQNPKSEFSESDVGLLYPKSNLMISKQLLSNPELLLASLPQSKSENFLKYYGQIAASSEYRRSRVEENELPVAGFTKHMVEQWKQKEIERGSRSSRGYMTPDEYGLRPGTVRSEVQRIRSRSCDPPNRSREVRNQLDEELFANYPSLTKTLLALFESISIEDKSKIPMKPKSPYKWKIKESTPLRRPLPQQYS